MHADRTTAAHLLQGSTSSAVCSAAVSKHGPNRLHAGALKQGAFVASFCKLYHMPAFGQAIQPHGASLVRQVKLPPPVLHKANVLQGIRPAALQRVRQPGLAELISVCIAPRGERPEAKKLLKHPYFSSIREVCSPGLCCVFPGAVCCKPSSCLYNPG